ncbi:hypothetical protein JST97_03190 [bacterium]|nr:hypothetical protein [bacterium]
MAISSSLPPVDVQSVEAPAPAPVETAEAPAPAPEPAAPSDQSQISGESGSEDASNAEQLNGFRDNFRVSMVAEATAPSEEKAKPKAASHSLITSSAAETNTQRSDRPNQTQAGTAQTSRMHSAQAGGKQDQVQQLLDQRQGEVSNGTEVVARDQNGQPIGEGKLQAFADGSANLRDGDDRLLLSADAQGGMRSLGYDKEGRINSLEVRSKGEQMGLSLQGDGTWKDSQGQSLRGEMKVNDKGDITFRQEDGSSRSWQHNGTQIERQGDRILSTQDAQGRKVRFEYEGDRLSKLVSAQGERQLKDAQVNSDGSVSASEGNGRVHLQPDGSSIVSDRKGTTASAYNAEGQLTEVRSGDRSSSFGYDDQGKLNRVDFQGRSWERGAERDGHSRWHSQDGQGFTGEIQAEADKLKLQTYDPARGTRTESEHSLTGHGGSQRSFDKNDKLTGETIFQADGGRRERIFDDQGKDTGRYLHTDKDGQLSLDGKSKLDPLSAELKTYSRSLDNHGETRPAFNAEKSAEKLYRSLAGADDEKAIFNELAGRSKEELKQIQERFQERYKYSLRSDLISDLSFSDEDRALAYLDGNHAKGDAIGLRNQMGDIKEVENLLQRQRSPEDVKAIEAAYREMYKSDYGQDFNRRWKGYDHEISANRALMAGDRSSAAAAKAAYSLRNRDAEGVFQALSGPDGQALSDASRQAIKDRFSELTGGKNLALDIDRNLVGNQNRRALALQFGDNAGAEAAVARTAMKGNESGGFYGLFEGWGTDEKGLEKSFERRAGESEQDWQARQAAVNRRYQQAYSSDRWRDAQAETSGTDRKRLESIRTRGGLSSAERIYTATVGMGTTEAELEAVLSKASTQELKEMRQDYARRYPGRDMDQDVLGDVSGRLHHDASQWLRGMPDRQSDPTGHFAEQMRRFNDTHAYERQGWQNAIGTTVTDTFFADGGRADQRHQQLQGLYQQARAEGFRGPTSDKFELELSRAQGDLNHYREGKDQATEGAATAVTTTAAVGVIFFTAGTATPLVVAGASIGAGAGSNLVTRAAMGGKEYTAGDALKDTTLGGLDGATNLILPGVGKAASPLLKTAAGQATEKVAMRALSNPVVARSLRGAADGALGGATMGMAYAAADDRTWDEGVLQGMKTMGAAGMRGAEIGAVTGGVTANVVPPLVEKGRSMLDTHRLNSLSKGLDESGLSTLGSLRENLGDRAAAEMLAGRANTIKQDLGQLQRTMEALPAHQQQSVTRALQEMPELRKHLLEGGDLKAALDATARTHPDKLEQVNQLREQLKPAQTEPVEAKVNPEPQLDLAAQKAAREAELEKLRQDQFRQIETAKTLADKGNPTAKKLLDLARDADKQGEIGPVSFREAKVLLREEMRGNLKEVARGPKKTDGVELGGKGQTWDIKSPVSGPVDGAYTDQHMVNLVEKKLKDNTYVIIDKDRLNAADRAAVEALVEKMGPQWAGKVRTYTTRSEQPGIQNQRINPVDIPPVPQQLQTTGVVSPPEGIRLSRKADANMGFEDYLNRPQNWAERFFGRKLPAYVGTPESLEQHAALRQQMEESIKANWGNAQVARPDYAFSVPTKDLIFAQGGTPTVNAATLAKYQAGTTDGQLLLHIPTPDGSKYLVIEGHHRSSAAMLRGETSIEPSRVFRLDQVDELRLAGYDRESLLEAAQKHTRHLWVIDR